MPESKARKKAADKKKAKNRSEAKAASNRRLQSVRIADRAWVPYVFVPVGLLGVIWLVVFYIAGATLPFMAVLGNWNFLIGLGLIAASFFIATFWK